MKRFPLLAFTFLLCAVGCSVRGQRRTGDRGESAVDGGDAPKQPKKVVADRRATWRPRGRTVGWGAGRYGGAMRICDGDRKKPARNRPEWAKWKKANGARRSYRNASHEEFHARIFEETEAMVAENQASFGTGEASYELEINQFADYSEEEIAKLGMGEIGRQAAMEMFVHANESDFFVATSTTGHLNRSPSSIDWRQEGKVPPIKYQGGCGSCYAFAAVGAIESAIAIKHNVSIDLSEQHIVDCSTRYGNLGCHGGWVPNVFRYVQEATCGVVREQDYPYTAKESSCPALPRGVAQSKLASYRLIESGDEKALEAAIGTVGPVCIALDVSQSDFSAYKSGVYNNAKCSNTPSHAVVLVGYGSENGVDFFILRNSWDTTWGEKGYMRIRRGVNMCGLALYGSYPILA